MQHEDLGRKYINFLEKIGFSIDTLGHDAKLILAENCQKVVNGDICCKNLSEIQEQLIKTREMAGKWEIKLHNIIFSDESNSCIVQYDISSENLGSFIIIAILKYNNLLIEEINEVFHQR